MDTADTVTKIESNDRLEYHIVPSLLTITLPELAYIVSLLQLKITEEAARSVPDPIKKYVKVVRINGDSNQKS